MNAIDLAKQSGKKLHLLGLVSDGGVHSHTSHLKAICSICHDQGLNNVFVHAFTDGRDTDPKSGLGYIQDVEAHLKKTTGTIATVSGRYYAMDRDKRWERVAQAYHCLVNAKGNTAVSAEHAIQSSYGAGVTDEFILPTVIIKADGAPVAKIEEGDVVIAFNFRTDRCREITEVLTQQAFPEQNMHPLNLHYTTMTMYDQKFKGVNVIFENDNLTNTIGEVLAAHGKKQIRIAETEKYPHVTFFFSGGREEPFTGESRIMAPSPKVATYDLQPEMSAAELTEKILPEIAAESADFICLNFANADMVGHTGVFSAVVKAVETVDACVAKIVTLAIEHGYTIFLTADHGNADYLINKLKFWMDQLLDNTFVFDAGREAGFKIAFPTTNNLMTCPGEPTDTLLTLLLLRKLKSIVPDGLVFLAVEIKNDYSNSSATITSLRVTEELPEFANEYCALEL
ncbi:MAG: phosphoglycerate mutase (2,3-diphosphoglycerate-independent), partial [Sphingobacteriia bacterium 32-37-4]